MKQIEINKPQITNEFIKQLAKIIKEQINERRQIESKGKDSHSLLHN